MTDQVREKLIYKRRTYRIIEEPLDRYLVKNKIKSPFDFQNTGCWRCYEGTWKVKYNKLYLAKLEAFTDEFKNKVGVDFLFPGQKEVFAEWYSGVIRLPIEKEEYLPYSIACFSEDGLFLKFKKGVLVSSKLITEKPI